MGARVVSLGSSRRLLVFTIRSLSLAPVAACLASIAAAQGSFPQIGPKPASSVQTAVGPCVPGTTSMLINLSDGGFSVVTMNGTDGACASGAALPGDPCQRNDDDVTLAI